MITSYSFGSIVVDGTSYEDIKIIDGKVSSWHYIEHHTVTAQDIIELVDAKPEYIVIGLGASSCVRVKDEVKELAADNNIKLVIEDTKTACSEYNRLLKNKKRVCAVLHSTC